MAPEPFNPYAPPEAGSAPTAGSAARRRRWGEVVFRALAVILGFSLVADPTALPGVETALGRAIGGYLLARGIGLALLAAGFLPWSGYPPSAARTASPEGSEPNLEEL